MLTMSSVSKQFESFQVLKNINLEFNDGVYGLLAPNGAGKTTLIKMLTTLIVPSKGEILYKGQNIFHLGSEYRGVLGYLPQDFGYYKSDTPTKYLLYLAALKGMEKAEAQKRVAKLLKLVALAEVAHVKMKNFSGGMIQRVGIAQALLSEPKILILDEPTVGLDPKERVRFRNLLSELGRDRIVILSTHIVSDVESIANEIIMLKDHEVLYQRSVASLCKMLQGRVFETNVDYEELNNFRQQYLVLSEKQESNQMRIRFVGDNGAKAEWESVNPNLEDVFLVVYEDKNEYKGGVQCLNYN